MKDPVFQLLLPYLNANAKGDQGGLKQLWVVDENLDTELLPQLRVAESSVAITNRVDVAEQLEQCGFKVSLCDFDLNRALEDFFPGQLFDVIYYRISKEKALVHHVINQAAHCLSDGGELLLVGGKGEGIKTYAAKAETYFAGGSERKKGKAATLLYRLEKSCRLGPPLDDKAYAQAELQTFSDISFYSKPGVYGWNKIDQGSELLIEQLDQLISASVVKPEKILDLGCGYGYLSIMASQRFDTPIIATDSNITAVAMCRKNFQRAQIEGEVILANCAEGIDTRVDLLLCNPPFHQGFSVEGLLTVRFLMSARRLLTDSGVALFVVNSFIPLEKKAESLFGSIRCLINTGQFKVLLLKK